MKLTVLSVAYPLVPVSRDTAGGAEQIVSILDGHIVRAGGRSLVLAAEGSRVSGRLLPAPRWSGTIDERVRAWAAGEHRRRLAQALGEFDIDVVHFHGLDFHQYLPPSGVPCLATLHLPPSWYPPAIFQVRSPHMRYICVSRDQRQRCPASSVSIATIPDGIEVQSFEMSFRKRRYALTLGRICPEKGIHSAIDAAREARVPMIVAGEVFAYPAHQEYFRREIVPRLDRAVRFVRPVGFRRKRRLLAGARCLLVPSTVPETSSLVAMEALACGTPVVAFRSGALPEVIEHGRTGFIVDAPSELAEAIERAGELDPEDCRKSAGERFSAHRMAEAYFQTYRDAISSSKAVSTQGAADLSCAAPVS